MRANEFGNIGPEKPIDSRRRIPRSKLDEHGYRVKHIAERGGFDQQNALEITSA
jgi:hypothetical protein